MSDEKKGELSIIKSRIGLRLLLPYLIISLLILVLMLSLLYFNFRTQINSTEKIQEEISLKASSEINFYISSIIEKTTLISRNIHCIQCDDANTMELVKTLMETNPSIYELAIVDSSGKEVNKIVRYNPAASEVLKEVTYEDKFIEAYKGELYIGEYYMSDYLIPFLSISFPIIDENDNIIGVLSAEIDLSPMWNTISKIKVKRTGYVYVVNYMGDLIAYKDINLIKKNVNLGDIPIVKEALGEKGEELEKYVSFTNEEVIGKWNSVEITNWAVIVELPMREVYGEMIPLFIIAGLSLVLLIAFILIMFLIILRRVLKPIGYLQEGVSKIEAGNLNKKVEVGSKDEIGQLAESFNLMTQKLKKSYEDLEEKVRQRTKELLESNKLKDLFMDIMRHDLLNPAGVVRLNSQLALKGEKDVKKKEVLEAIERDSNRMITMIQNASILARLESGEKIDLKEKDLGVLLKGSVEELSERAKEKNMKINVNAEGKFPAIVNPLIQNVFSNFLSNAIKYSPEKTEIIAGIKKKGEDWLVYVEDRGEGIPAKYKKSIFERFTRLEKGAIKGSGLGLAISKKIAEAHNGKIWVGDHKGGGSVFYVLIPKVRKKDVKSTLEGTKKKAVAKPVAEKEGVREKKYRRNGEWNKERFK